MLECDYIVIGGGQSGMYIAKELTKTDKKIILLDEKKLGGSYIFNREVPENFFKKEADIFFSSLKTFKDNPETFSILIKYRQKLIKKIKTGIQEKAKISKEELNKNKNFTFIKGKASFLSKNLLEVNSETERHLITFKKAVLTIGRTRLILPNIKGVEKVKCFNSSNIYELNKIPSELALIGLSEKNIQVAYDYASLGVKVKIFEEKKANTVLKKVDKTAYNYVIKSLLSKQVSIDFETKIVSLKEKKDYIVLKSSKGKEYSVSELFLNEKRDFEEDFLGLDKLGIWYDDKGVQTNRQGKTKYNHIYALGDCSRETYTGNKFSMIRKFLLKELKNSGSPFSLAEDIVGFEPFKIETKDIWQIKTNDPALTIGTGEEEAISDLGSHCKTIVFGEKHTNGFLKIIYKENSENILGFSLCGDYCKKFNSFCIFAYKKNMPLQEVIYFIEASKNLT